MSYLLHLVVLVGVYLILAYSLNLMVGFAGLVSFCHAAFYGIGAYFYAILVVTSGVHPLPALAAAILGTGLLGFAIGSVSLRFRGDLFLFVTLGFQMIVFVLLYNWVGLTNGPYGLAGIPRPSLFGFVLRTPLHMAGFVVAANMILLPFLFFIYRSPFAMTLKALRENEAAAQALGVDPTRMYLQAFTISASFAAVPGVLFATYVTYIDPTSFTLKESILLVAILLLGGSGNRIGPFLGTIIMLLLPELLRFVGLPDPVAHNTRGIIYGLLLAALMILRPRGIAGEVEVASG